MLAIGDYLSRRRNKSHVKDRNATVAFARCTKMGVGAPFKKVSQMQQIPLALHIVIIILLLFDGVGVMLETCTGCLVARRGQCGVDCDGDRGASCAAATSPAGRRFYQILYLGEHELSPTVLDSSINDIRAETAARATAFRLTGALLLTKGGFAQLLEGPRAEVEKCLAALRSDPRHANGLLLEEGGVGARQFDGWSVSYADPASFVGRVTFRAITAAAFGARNEINRLVRLMVQADASNDDDIDAAALDAGDHARTAA